MWGHRGRLKHAEQKDGLRGMSRIKTFVPHEYVWIQLVGPAEPLSPADAWHIYEGSWRGFPRGRLIDTLNRTWETTAAVNVTISRKKAYFALCLDPPD